MFKLLDRASPVVDYDPEFYAELETVSNADLFGRLLAIRAIKTLLVEGDYTFGIVLANKCIRTCELVMLERAALEAAMPDDSAVVIAPKLPAIQKFLSRITAVHPSFQDGVNSLTPTEIVDLYHQTNGDEEHFVAAAKAILDFPGRNEE